MGCCGRTSYKVTVGQIKELAKTVGAATKEAIKSGEVRVTKDIQERRMVVCKQCPDLQGARCEKCGCFIAAKVMLKVSKCPVGKW